MRAEIYTDDFMLSFFSSLSLAFIINGNGWIV